MTDTEILTVDDSSADESQEEALILNFKRDCVKQVKAEHRVKTEDIRESSNAKAKAEPEPYDFGDLTRSENPLRKLVVPTELLREFEAFEIRMSEKMASYNPPHSADYDRCMFCWLKHTMKAADPSMRDSMGRFLLFTGAYYEMYYSTLEGSKCIECEGSLPLGKDETTGADRSEF